MPDVLSRLIVAPSRPLTQIPLGDVMPNLTLRAPQGGSDLGRLTDSFHLNLTAFGLLSFAVGIFIVHGAIGLAFEQRRPVIRTLRALGFPLGRLVALIGVELLVISLVAGAIGVGLGYLVAARRRRDDLGALWAICFGHIAVAPRVVGIGPFDRRRGHRNGRRRVAVAIGAHAIARLRTPPCMGNAGGTGSIIAGGGGRRIANTGGGTGMVGQWPRSGVWNVGRTSYRGRIGIACRARPRSGVWRCTGEIGHGRMVLGRHAPAIAGLVIGLDGVAVGDGGKRRCINNGQQFSPDIHRVPGSAARLGILCLCGR
jgi:hypothetical protein